MAKFYNCLDESLMAFIQQQQMFFTASAAPEGRINLSPKGIDTLRCLDASTVAYLDLTGSGNETAAHLQADGRLTLMFCSFGDRPLILRLYGKGQVICPDHPEWELLHQHFDTYPGERQIIRLNIESAQTSCGFGVPRYEFSGQRETLLEWAEKKGHEGLNEYRQQKNTVSIDGLPTGVFIDA